jgi:hypothetical protein
VTTAAGTTHTDTAKDSTTTRPRTELQMPPTYILRPPTPVTATR